MEKHTNPILYRFGDNKVEILPYFLYDVSIYKITKDTAFCLESCYYKSDKLLNIKKETISKKFLNYSIVKYISIIGVTKQFAEDNHLPIWELKKRKKK